MVCSCSLRDWLEQQNPTFLPNFFYFAEGVCGGEVTASPVANNAAGKVTEH
jgi:hypothetical protein